MEKIFKLSKLNNNGIEGIKTPIKINPNKYKENILNSFLQDTYYQNKTKNKSNNIQINSKEKSKSDLLNYKDIERKSKYANYKNNNKNTTPHNYPQNISFSGQKIKYKNENNRKYTILNPFKERSSFSSKSILIPTNENQISIIKNPEILNISKIRVNNKSFIFEEVSDKKKMKRNNTVYIKKHLSKEKNIKKIKNQNISNKKNKTDNNKNKAREDNLKDYYGRSNKYIIPRANSSAAVRKKINNSEEKPRTNNINSNVNIFNFDMKYNNVPNYFIKNSKIYNPYFNNYIANNLNNETELSNYTNLISLKNKKIKNNINKSYNNEFTDIENSEEREINNTKVKDQIFEQSAIIIQSVYRGCVIRFQINNLLRAYKGIDALTHFFKYYFWKYFRYNLIMKSNILNNEIDSKMSISSISCISALFNSNNKNFKSFNSKLFKEVHESFFVLNHNNSNNNNNKYLDKFQDANHNKNVIWNKKKVNKKYLIPQNNKNNNIYSINNKEKCLKKIILKKINISKINLMKNFMKFYFNGIYFKKILELNTKNKLKYKKLTRIIEIKEIKNKVTILRKNFNKFRFFGLVKYIENNLYYLANGGRLFDLSRINSINKDTNKFRILKKIRLLKKIIFKKPEFNKNILKIYFYKFHLLGIFYYMKKELTKRIIANKLFLSEKDNNNIILKNTEAKIYRIKIIKNLINKKSKEYYYICRNIFDKWCLRTKIFSMIAIDKEKKKKRRIKKRNNKKLGTNNSNNPNKNINLNNSSNSNNINNINKKIDISNDSNKKLNPKKQILQPNYFVDHCNSIIFSNNIKINDYHRLNIFIQKINNILTKKFYFFSLVCNKNNPNKKKENKNEINKINEEIDFFIEDSSDNSED